MSTGRRVALVTGGSAGIGEALARRLCGRGMHVIVSARGGERLDAAAAAIGAQAVAADVCSEEGRAALVGAVRAAGRLDLLVNNAGRGGGTTALDIDVARVRHVLELNFYAHVALTRALLGLLVRPGAAIVNVTSVLGLYAVEGSSGYGSSKFALTAWSRALAAGLRGQGVHVLTAAPGAVPTTTFPHTERMQRRLGRLLTIPADGCAERILRALDDGRHEVVAPAWYRPFVAFEACAPGLATRVMRNRYL